MIRPHYPLRLFRSAIALLVLMIAVHALTPLGQPAQRLAGSAFSAETAEVSLRAGQRAVIAKSAELPKVPLATIPVRITIAPRIEITPASGRIASGLGATGPPPIARTSFSPLSPRAPPAA